MRRLCNLLFFVVVACAWYGYGLRDSEPGGAVDEAVSEQQNGPEPVRPSRRTHSAPAHAPDNTWAKLNAEAILALDAERFEEAIAGFEACAEAVPSAAVYRRNLMEALVRAARYRHALGELEPAVTFLERGLELADGTRGDEDALGELLARWKHEMTLEAEHETRSSDLFELSYDTRRDDLLHDAQALLNHLERIYEDLREWFAVDPVRDGGRAPIKVVVYDKAEFGALTGLGDWAGGVFDGVVRLPVEDLEAERESWEEVLRHELVHAFATEIGGPSVPGWLNEGLAQFLELRPGLDAARRKLRLALDRGHELFPLERLIGGLSTWDDAQQIALAYAQSLVLVDHIQKNYGEDVLRKMVAGCSEGRTAAETFESMTGIPLDFVLADVPRYL